MRGNCGTPTAFARLRNRALGSTALTVLTVIATQGAWAAAPTPPAAGTLPGSFSTNIATVTYAGTGTTATITTGAGNNVLQWGGTALATKVSAPSGITTNTGFSIGSGATLNVGGVVGTTGVLVSDQTGNPSQVYGALNAGGLPAGVPLYVSNTNGVIVGSTGTITAPAAGVGLLGYAVDATAFGTNGFVTVNNSTTGGGAVTVANGASISNGPLLVASNGTVNIGAVSTAAAPSNYVLAGWQFSTAAGSVVPAPVAPPGGVRSDGASSVVNFTAPATLIVDELYAGGAVNNAATLTLTPGIPALVAGGVAGLFTNTGTLNETADLGANQLAGGLANLGTINEQNLAGGLTIISAKGNVQSTGVLNLTATGLLEVEGANVDLEGTVQIATKPLSTTNQLTGGLTLSTTAAPAQSGGVVDIGTSLFTSGGALVAGNAIRVLSGGIFASAGNAVLDPGTDAAAVADPFYSLKSLGYTFSLFPGTQVSDTGAGTEIVVVNPVGGTSFSNSSGLNLDGQLSAPTIIAIANNIHSNNGLAGGFSVPNGGTIELQFFGNVNNPSGAAANGSTSFLYNYVPVTVGPNGAKAGTATIEVAGPSYSSTTDQNVNLLVQGNVNLEDGAGFFGVAPLNAPTSFPTAPISPYANNHLVVTATGNIGLSEDLALLNPTIFYWPGMVYLTSGATASNPTAAPSSTASISLGTTSANPTVSLSNIIPADLTKPDVSGQTGGGGVHFLTNNLILSPGTGASGTVTISNDSWANFLTAAIASAFATTSPSQFLDGYIQSNGQVNTQKLPAADFQP